MIEIEFQKYGYEPVTFSSAKDMLLSILDGNDYYSPDKEIYVFVYNDNGAICIYNIGAFEVAYLVDKQKETNDYWGAHLSWGGNILEDPSENESTNNTAPITACERMFKGTWYNVTKTPTNN